jgi:hypothetical protein
MNVPESMQLCDGAEHLGDVELGVLLLEDARVVEEGAEVTACDKVHREVDVRRILEGVQQSHEPGGRRRREDVSFCQDVSDLSGDERQTRLEEGGGRGTDLVHLEQRPLPQLLERNDLVTLLVPRQIYLAVASLSDLREDMELVELEFRPPLAE